MADKAKASRLAQEGLAHWEEAELELALQKTNEAIVLAEPNHWMVADYHGQLAGIHAQAGENDKARGHYEKALFLQLQGGEADGGITVIVCRHFLAMHLLEMSLASEALDVLQPSLQAAPVHWLNCVAHAHILHALRRFADAKDAAQLAIKYAPSLAKAEQLTKNLNVMFSEENV
ncbi:hypothetical protein ACO0LM_13610 [Undibacterium sp. Di26W]|uniref:hypothetical protein n=1 Tax=Undibacterium sp. Di26W TaxID=3413035 RepID=UPI003BEFAF04